MKERLARRFLRGLPLLAAVSCSAGTVRSPQVPLALMPGRIMARSGPGGRPIALATDGSHGLSLDSLEHILRSQYSGLRDPVRTVVRDSLTWSRWWEQVHAHYQSPPPAVPRMDFRRAMVVIVGLGVQNSTGFDVRIDSVIPNGATTVVVVRIVAPGRGCLVGNAETTPVDVVKVPTSRALVTFVDRFHSADCERS